MKKTLLFITVVVAVVITACSTLSPEEKAARNLRIAENVAVAIEKRNMTVEMTFMRPFRGRQRSLSSGYEIRVSGDTLYSYLPYIGGAWNVPYGGGKGLQWEAPLRSYTETPMKKGYTRIEMYVNIGEDEYLYMLDVYPDGTSYLDIRAREHDPISFTGKMTAAYE